MRQLTVFRRLQVAYANESWDGVVEHATALQLSDLPDSLAAPVALFHGRALFTLGRNRDALEQFAIGLGFPPPAGLDTTEWPTRRVLDGDLEPGELARRLAAKVQSR